MLIRIRKTTEGTYAIEGNTYFIAGIAAFAVTFLLRLLFSWQIFPSLTSALILTLIVMPFVYLGDQIGKKKHRRIIESKLFGDLQQLNFQIENVQDYWALIGEYEDYCVRIYYNWNKRAEGFLSFGDIVLMVYHDPVLVKGSSAEIDFSKLEEMNLPVRGRFWTSRPRKNYIRFTPNYLLQHVNYYPFITTEQILRHLKALIQLAKENQLIPTSKEEVEAVTQEYGYYYAPQVETFEFREKYIPLTPATNDQRPASPQS
jgi:hypothetical protein